MGWKSVHAIDREDVHPSAAINVGSNPNKRGIYVDHAPTGKGACSFFDMLARMPGTPLSKREAITGPVLARKLKVSVSSIHGDMKIFVKHRLCKRSGYKGYERTDRFQPVVRHLRQAKAIPSREKTWGRLIEWRKIVGS